AARAIRSLVAAPRQAVRLIRSRLQSEAEQDAERFARLVRRLDDKAFAVREAAQKELEQWDALPLKLVKTEAESNPSVEVRSRLKRVLEGRKKADPEADNLRALRCLEVLEHVGTPEAREVLNALAEKAADPLLRQEARASLGRLRQR